MNYLELKNKHAEEFNDFPIAFAFSGSQFIEAIEELGLKPSEADKIHEVVRNGFIRKSDLKKFKDMFKRHEAERNMAMATSDKYIESMFSYELANHEYGYTMDATDTLEALGLTADEIKKDARLLKGFNEAVSKVSFD